MKIKTKRILGFMLIAVVIGCFGYFSFYSINEIETLETQNTALKKKKDCTIHQSIIDELTEEKISLQKQNEAVVSSSETIARDVETYLQIYFTRYNTSVDTVLKNIKPLVSNNIYIRSKNNLADFKNSEIQTGIRNIKTYSTLTSTDTADVYSVYECWLKSSPKSEKIKSTLMFSGSVSYDSKTKKWIITKIDRQQGFKYIAGQN